MFGGNTANPMMSTGWSNETWSFDPSTELWMKMSPATAPGGFLGDMTYNIKADRVILVLNTDPTRPNDVDFQSSQTWAYDFNTDTWTQFAEGPSGRVGAVIAYDSESDKVILFGGFSLTTNQFFDETWAYDFNTDIWTQMQTETHPKDQNFHCMVYDPQADRILNWGGGYGGNLWTYDYNTNTWEEMITETQPGASYYAGCTFDDKAGLLILYGGSESGSDETWTYDLSSNLWQQRHPPQNPGILSRNQLVYEPVTDRSILFSGQVGKAAFFYVPSTWAYNLNADTWTEIIPGD